MNIGIILAGGSGSRISGAIPKQLIKIGDKPILIHTAEIFLLNNRISDIIIVCNKNIIFEVNELVKFHFLNYKNKKIQIIEGGETRNDSLLMSYNFLKKNYKISNKDILITHDAVRMFVDNELINNSIDYCKSNHIIVPTIDLSDSIFKIDSGITMIDRNSIKRIQTPQTLHYETFKSIFDKEIDFLEKPDWDLCWLSQNDNINILNIKGDNKNIKITTDFDLLLAKTIYDNTEER